MGGAARARFEAGFVVSTLRFDFSGARVLVTGGSNGLGLGMARAFAAAGFYVERFAVPDEFPEVIEMLATGDDTVDAMISHQVDWDDFPGAFSAARDTARAVKVVVRFPGIV